MKKKTEKAYFDEQWEGMTAHLKAFIHSGDQVELHQFRVQVKKLKAMLTLLDTTSSKHKLLKDFKPVIKIFKHCGDIRNAYINLQLGVRYHITNEEFLMGQLYEIESKTNQFKKQGKKYLKIIKTTHNIIRNDLRAIDNSKINEFYKTRLKQISDTFANLQFNEDLHTCRKQIKTLAYNRKMAHPALEGKLQLNEDYLDKLQDSIGNWHDNILAMELLSTTGVNEKPIITKIKRQNTRLKRSITTLSRDFRRKVIVTDKVLAGN